MSAPGQTAKDSPAAVALVTGANRGLGRQTAAELARRGLRVVLACRDAGAGEGAARNLRSEGWHAIALPLELDDELALQQLVAEVEHRYQRLDVLINNAGAMLESGLGQQGQPPKLADVDRECLQRSLDTHLLGAYVLCRAVLPGMNRRGYGRIVNVSSGMGALTGMEAGFPAYRIAKAALNALSCAVAAEAEQGVKVNSVCPGWVQTDLGGAKAPRTVQQGAEGIVWAATLPADGPSGGFFRDGQPLSW